MNEKKFKARELYLGHNLTQREIATQVGVSERTIYTWVHQFAWHKLKTAATQAPAIICDNLYSQLAELQNTIAARAPGSRYPTAEEATITRKLLLCIEGMKKQQSLSQSMQTMQAFRDYVRPINARLARQVAHYSHRFFEATAENTYAPYQLEYGIEKSAAINPFYSELHDDTTPLDTTTPLPEPEPCTDIMKCTRTTGCDYPHCKTDRYWQNDPMMSHPPQPWAIPPQPIPPMQPPAPQSSPQTSDTISSTKPEATPQITDNKQITNPSHTHKPEATGSSPTPLPPQ
jgi:transposase-like protein